MAKLTRGTIRGHLVSQTLPMIFGVAAIMSVGLIDAYFIGQLGAQELAAVSFIFPITIALSSLGVGVMVGINSVIARALGEGDEKRAERRANFGAVFALATGILLGLVLYLLLDPLFRLMQASEELLPLIGEDGKKLGSMIMIEDISNEKRMKSTMSRYMDPGIADQLMGDGSSEDFLGGKSSEITVLFSDIRSFTAITEALGAQDTVQMLNEYFTIMVDCITREGGMLDKFIGDAIMAGFGIPVSHDDDEDRAVRAAIAMITGLWEWNVERVARGENPVDHGVGLNTGMVVSGNIGSPKRMDYTMIGDGVNLAARLESACKQYSARILISEFTKAKLKGTYRMRDIDMVVVKGKTEPVGVYEVLDYHTDETYPNLMDNVNYFNEGVKEYRKGSWDKGISRFEEAIKANENDKLAQTYIERCEHLKAEPPEDWNGVWVMTSK